MKKVFLLMLTLLTLGFAATPVLAQDPCNPISVSDSAWFEDFEGYLGSGNVMFQCWATPATSSYGSPFIYCGWAPSCHSGTNSAEMKGNSGEVCVLVLPEFTNDINTLRLTFWATATSVSYGTLEVGVMTDPTDPTTFELVGTCGAPGPRGTSGGDGNGNFMGPFDFNGVTATSARIALRFTSNAYALSWNLDDFTVTLIPDCAEPSGLAVSGLTSNSADLTWNEIAGNTYDLVYWTSAGDTTVEYSATLTDGIYTLSNLTPNTSYSWYVRNVCGDGTYSNSFSTLSFLTPNVPVDLPYDQDFETDPALITDFTLQAQNSNAWIIGSATFMPEDPSDNTETGHSLYISNNGSSYAATYEDFANYEDFNAYATLDVQFPSDAVEWHLSFDYKVPCPVTSYAYMSVYLVDAANEISTSVAPQGINLSGQLNGVTGWTHADYVLPNVANGTKKIVFYWYNSYYATNYSSGDPAAVDNIAITSTTCAQPSNLSSTDVTSSTAMIHWQENGTATAWTVYYRPLGSSTWLEEYASEDSLMLTNLGGNTTYEYRVTADCFGEESNFSPTATFHTQCGDNGITVLPFMEDFEGEPVNGFVACWTRSTNDTTGTHNVYQNVDEVWAWGSKALDFGYTPGCYTQATLPMFNSSIPLNTLKVEFDARRGSSEGAFLFGALTDPEDDATFVVIDTIFTSCTGSYYSCDWEHITIFCNNYTGSGQYFAFRADNCGSSARLIDNLVIDELPACLPVSDVTVTDPTLNGATITWSGSADAYNVYVGGNVYYTTDTSIVISDLNASSSYSVTVRALCAIDSSELSAPVSFSTSCGLITVTADAPWEETFEGYSGSGEQSFVCWDAIVQPNGPFVYCGHSPSCHSGSNSAEFKGSLNMLVLPEFTNNLSELRLSFWATSTNVSLGNVEVGYMTDITDPSTFVFVANAGTPGPRGASGTTGNGNYMGAFDFNGVTAPAGSRIALRYTNTNAYASWNLDDFTVTLVPGCPSPVKTSVQATNVDGHNATITFVDNDPDHDSWTVYYREHSATADDPWNAITTSTTSADITGLDPVTTYDVYVVTNCTTPDVVEDATLTIQFTTTVSCPAPENVTVSGIGMSGATVTWNSNADSFTIEYGEEGFTPGTGTTDVATTNSYELSGLTAGTNYTVYVTAECGVEDVSSAAMVTFNTTLCDTADQCAYIFTLTDSWGDGWNGGSLKVKQNGIIVATLSLASGSSAVETVYLCDNDSTSIEWVAGSYQDEAGFSVAAPGDVEIYSIVGMDNYNTPYTFTSNCTPPTCMKPTSIEVTNISSTSADVNWVVAGTETAWNLEYKSDADADWTVVSVTTNSYTLTNLTAYTHYSVRVQADCGGGDVSEYKETSFTTECDVITTFPFEEGFESGSLGCWSQETLVGNNPWSVYMYSSNTGTYSVHMSYTDNTSSRLASPIFDLTGLTNPMVSFYYSLPEYLGAVDTFAVYYRTSDVGDWVRMAGYDQITSGFVMDSLTLPNPSATYQIAFVGYGIDGNAIYLDDIRVYDGSGSAPVITATVATQTATAVSQTTATMNAVITNPNNDNITAKGFEWMPLMGTDYTQVYVTTGGNNYSYDLTNLTPNTDYMFKAFIVCNGTTIYGNELMFYTLEEGQQTEPTATTLPASNVEQTTATLNGTIANPDNVTITAQGFEWKQASAATYTTVSAAGATMAAPLTGLTANTAYTYRAFVTTANGTHYGADVNFTTQEEPVEPCNTPTGLTVGNITHESIEVTWDNADVTSWNVQYRVQNGQWSSTATTSNSYTITGLTPETTYQIQVQANCGNGNLSEWSSMVTATTTVGIESWLESSIALYPNPAREYVDIRVDGNVNVTSMEVYDVYGKLINAMNVVENPTRINVSNLANGMYFVRVNTEEGMVTKTFVKR